MINKSKLKIAFAGLGLTPVFADTPTKDTTLGGVGTVTPPTTINVTSIVDAIINWGFGLLIVLAAGFILFAAFTYLTAGGKEENLTKAKNLIIYAVAAIVVGFVARGLVSLVRGLLGA